MTVKLEARGIRLDYLRPRTTIRQAALQDVDLQVMEGEFLSIVGPSGCGKTTFLSVVDGLIPATAGTITVDGREVSAPGPDRAMVFQDASLLPWRSVVDNVRLHARRVSAPGTSSTWWACRVSSSTTRTNSPAACSSASTWRARW